MSTEHNIRSLIINKLTKAQYEGATLNADELYLTPDDSMPFPNVITDATSINMALKANTIYKWTNPITSLSFASIEVGDLETVLFFTTGGSISFTDSSSLNWGGGSSPSLEINTKYCIAICNGLAEIDSFGTVS